jgi:hypothetical protein
MALMSVRWPWIEKGRGAAVTNLNDRATHCGGFPVAAAVSDETRKREAIRIHILTTSDAPIRPPTGRHCLSFDVSV